MWANFWDWLAKLPPGSAIFIGTLTGSTFGLIAIVIGALFNARLNRQRDDDIREADRVAVASALYAELSNVHRAFIENAESLAKRRPAPNEGFVIPEPSVKIFPELISKLGLLKSDTITSIMTAYLLTEQYLDGLILLGGTLQTNMPEGRQMVYLNAEHADTVRKMNEIKAGPVKDAMGALSPYLK
jgi:hypothetical protein